MKILFSSDVSFHYFGKAYPGDDKAITAMKEVKPFFAQSDFSVINLETTFGYPEDHTPIKKSGPNQISSPEFIKYIESLAPSAAGLANNHTLDFGEKPLFNTVNALNEMGIKTFGAGANINDAYNPICFEQNDIRVAVIGVCENEFGTAKEDKAGSAGYSLGMVTAAIQSAISSGYMPIIFFHGGNEYCPFPAPSKKELYRHFVDIGAGAVIAMHTHCPQGYELYRGAPIIYSMGNFYFPAPPYTNKPRYKVWSYGYMSLLTFENGKTAVEIVPYKQDFEGIHILHGREREHFEKYLDTISLPIANDELLQRYFYAWCIKESRPSKLKKRLNLADGNFAHIKNMFCCEAHNDTLRTEATVRFEEKENALTELISDIKQLQEMEIPNKK